MEGAAIGEALSGTAELVGKDSVDDSPRQLRQQWQPQQPRKMPIERAPSQLRETGVVTRLQQYCSSWLPNRHRIGGGMVPLRTSVGAN